MVHIDIVGPFDVSLAGNRYYVGILADCTKVHSIVPAPLQTFAFAALKDFITRIERQSGIPGKVVRSDGGLEFRLSIADIFYKSSGILHQPSPRYTPELNGVVERLNRTIKEMLSAMIAGTPLGQGFWDYAAKYAAIIIN